MRSQEAWKKEKRSYNNKKIKIDIINNKIKEKVLKLQNFDKKEQELINKKIALFKQLRI